MTLASPVMPPSGPGARAWIRRLHADEAGVEVVEALLLLVLALIVLTVLYKFVRWAIQWLRQAQQEMQSQSSASVGW